MSGYEVAFEARTPRSDADLIAGSQSDFGVLFDRYAARIYQYCVHRVGRHLAEDVVAETFLIAYERRHRYDLRRPTAGPWLYGIATNLVRRRRGAQARGHRWVAESAGPDPAERVAERTDAEALVRSLADALAGLPRRQRDVLYLSWPASRRTRSRSLWTSRPPPCGPACTARGSRCGRRSSNWASRRTAAALNPEE